MKMVSQLTRQAMSRHRLLSSYAASVCTSTLSPVSPPPAAQPTGFQSIYPITEPTPLKSPSPTAPAPIQSAPSASAPPQSNRRTVYQQLMTSHDRMTERHLKHT